MTTNPWTSHKDNYSRFLGLICTNNTTYAALCSCVSHNRPSIMVMLRVDLWTLYCCRHCFGQIILAFQNDMIHPVPSINHPMRIGQKLCLNKQFTFQWPLTPEPLSTALWSQTKSLLEWHSAPLYQLSSSYPMQFQRYSSCCDLYKSERRMKTGHPIHF